MVARLFVSQVKRDARLGTYSRRRDVIVCTVRLTSTFGMQGALFDRHLFTRPNSPSNVVGIQSSPMIGNSPHVLVPKALPAVGQWWL
jgi:hypothetical protein